MKLAVLPSQSAPRPEAQVVWQRKRRPFGMDGSESALEAGAGQHQFRLPESRGKIAHLRKGVTVL